MREGWGLNVIEANAMGTPGLVYPVEGLVESTLHDHTGLVSQAETPESLADSLDRALRNPDAYQRHRVAAWERAKTFHWDVVLPQAWRVALPALGNEFISLILGSSLASAVTLQELFSQGRYITNATYRQFEV